MPHDTDTRRPTLYVTRGLPASGKSTLAKKMVLDAPAGQMARVNKDDLRAMLHGFWAGNVTENQIVASRDALVITHLTAGVDVIVDDTNVAMTHVNTLAAIAWELGANFEVIDLTDVPVEECLRRDALRGEKSVGEKVIRRMAGQLAKSKSVYPDHEPIKPVEHIDGLEHVVLCDIDGTLAHMAGRGPYDTDRVDEDTPDASVPGTVRSLLADGRTVIVFSGRKEASRVKTAAWLDEHVAPGLPLFMRADDDNRRDSLIKRDLFEAEIRGKFNVDFVLDDRDQVVRMWRTLGVPCYQTAPGAF